jgi:hypothetical protein
MPTKVCLVSDNRQSIALQQIGAKPVVADFVPAMRQADGMALGAPRNTPPEIDDVLNKAINAGSTDPKMNTRFAALGGTMFTDSPALLPVRVNSSIRS